MKFLHGQELVRQLRKCADAVTTRLWIAVPYIGSQTSLRRILGKKWFENPSVSLKVLTDTSDISNVDTETIRILHERGQVKSLTGLHAKIYIIDDSCLLTSANLTNTAFSRRHEIGVLFQSTQVKPFVDTFEEWWGKAENLKPEQLIKFFKSDHKSKEEKGVSLPTLWGLPDDPGAFSKNLAKKFLNYDRLLADYQDFARKYSSIQRLWKNKPLYFEIDGLFNYLYHHAPSTPSKEYVTKKPRQLSEKQQLNEIKKWAHNYKEWNDRMRKEEWGEDDVEWRLRSSKTLKDLLAPKKVGSLKKIDLETIFKRLNSLNSYPINRTKILNNNSVIEIRNALNYLVNGNVQLAARMDECNKIKHLGTSSMNEILGFTNPDKYPLINKNSNSGLRFFGYHLKAYN